MLTVSRATLLTPRTILRRTRLEDAPAMFEALKAPEIYAFVPRQPPRDVGDMAAHFARVMPETAPYRSERWLNWTVWRRQDGAALGAVEASVRGDHTAAIGYMFGLSYRGRGYARESVGAMLEELTRCGVHGFEAVIDLRNAPSQRLARALGFQHELIRGIDQIWRRGAHLP